MMHQSSPTSVTLGATGGSGMSAVDKTENCYCKVWALVAEPGTMVICCCCCFSFSEIHLKINLDKMSTQDKGKELSENKHNHV